MKPPKPTEPDMPNEVEELSVPVESAAGTLDDDGRDDERADENEIPVRETSEETEAPDEFRLDDEDESSAGSEAALEDEMEDEEFEEDELEEDELEDEEADDETDGDSDDDADSDDEDLQ